MNPREIEVHVEELVLHGFAANDRWVVADALQIELQRLVAERGLPAAWLDSPAKIDAGEIRLTIRPKTGRDIAGALHGGCAR